MLPARGYQDTRVDDIVEAAGLSHGTFYRYFANKDTFFQVLAEAAAGRAVDLVDRMRIDGTADDVRTWASDWMRTYEADGGIISTWREMRTNVDLTIFSQKVAASLFTRLVRVLERLPNTVYTLGLTSEADGVEIMTTILRRGYGVLAD